MTEQEVRRYLRQMKEEDSEQAFRGFYDLTYDRLFRIACYYLHRQEWAQEVVLDVFMRLWQQRDRLPEVADIEDYCFILTKHAALNCLEREMRQPSLPASAPLADDSPDVFSPASATFSSASAAFSSASPSSVAAGQGASPEDILIGEELFACYVKALDRLPQRCREVFIRIREEKQTYAQVAEELGISIHTVDAQLQKALSRLRQMLVPDEG